MTTSSSPSPKAQPSERQRRLIGTVPATATASASATKLLATCLLCQQHRFSLVHRRKIDRDRYGTRRHAAAMVDLWRTQFPGDEAEVVWDACASSGVMEEMGYRQ